MVICVYQVTPSGLVYALPVFECSLDPPPLGNLQVCDMFSGAMLYMAMRLG
jgi:hypothetical protein